jgi:hypothetical protein
VIPTEQEATVAVDAAARKAYEQFCLSQPNDQFPGFDDLDSMHRNRLREQVLHPVWAALEALPDRAEVAGENIALNIEKARNTHWQQHLKDHPHATGTSCPKDYGKHDAYAHAVKIARGEDG